MLIDTRALPPTRLRGRRNREELALTVETNGTAKHVVDAMMPKLFSEETRSHHAELISPVRAAMEADLGAGASPGAPLRDGRTRPDRTGLLASITVPTTRHGRGPRRHHAARGVAEDGAALPNAQLVIIPDASHLAPLENSGAAGRSHPLLLEQAALIGADRIDRVRRIRGGTVGLPRGP